MSNFYCDESLMIYGILEIKNLMAAQIRMNLMSDMLFHEMITEDVYKAALEEIATEELNMKITHMK